MQKGDLAFFYQSNCKEPGIVGTMEIVQEHSPDCELPVSRGHSLAVIIPADATQLWQI